MSVTILGKTGLRTSGDGDFSWSQAQRDGFSAFESRVGLEYPGDPNGNVDGSWLGQTCWDSTNLKVYFCSHVGVAAAATWTTSASGEDVGTVRMFLRSSLPSGWLAFDGVTRLKLDYGALYAVLPAELKNPDGISFVLPNLTTDAMAAIIGGTASIGTIVGSNQTADAGATTASVTTTVDGDGYDTTEAHIAPHGNGGDPFWTFITDLTVRPQTIPPITLTAHHHTLQTRGLRLLVGVKT